MKNVSSAVERKNFIMKIDMHTHCLPASICALHQPEQLPEMFKNKGMDAIVLTNHYYPVHCSRLSPDLKEQAQIYVDIFHRCESKGKEIGFKVFFGSEIKLINEPHTPEFLLYGLSEEDFLTSYPLYNSTQKELFEFCEKKDILMIQAHPFRTMQGYQPADMRYVHGIEIYNPHLIVEEEFENSVRLADENRKLKTSGSDFHSVEQAGSAGIVIPDTVENQFMLRDYLKEGKVSVFSEKSFTNTSRSKICLPKTA